MLHLKNEGEQKPFDLTFADAITRFGSRLEQRELGEAYRRVFTGQLEQYFVVLKEEQANSPNQPAQGPLRNFRKR
jgi:hypothetical protein